MLETNLGKIVITFDGNAAAFSVCPIENKRLFPDVNGAFLLKYDYANDGKAHTLRCFLEGCGVTGCPESGEDLEAISFYSQGAKLTIGCKGDFGWPEKYDYSGAYLSNGLEIEIAPHTQSKTFLFAVAWLAHCTAETETQTWLAADPTASTPGEF